MYEPLEEGATNAGADGADDAGVFAAPLHTDNGLLLLVTPFQVTGSRLTLYVGGIWLQSD